MKRKKQTKSLNTYYLMKKTSIWKCYSMSPAAWHSRKSKPMGQEKDQWRSGVDQRKEELAEHRGFLGQWKYWSWNDRCMLLYATLNLQNVQYQQWTVAEVGPSRNSESWRKQVHYSSGPRGVNTSSSEPRTKELDNFYRQCGTPDFSGQCWLLKASSK